jgi:hypothetical protein
MSFRCQNCNQVQESGTKETKVVTEVRQVTYPEVKDAYGKVRIPVGYETVQELKVCPDCAKKNFSAAVVGEKSLR